MKNLAIIISLFMLYATGFSQVKPGIPEPRVFTRAKLSEVKLISELVPDSVKNCKFITIDVVSRVGGKEITANGELDKVMEEVRNILKKADIGSKIYIDLKCIDPGTNAQSYRSLTFAIRVAQ